MRIKGFFYIFVILLLILGIGLLCLSGQLRPAFFYIGEGLILFILVYLVFFYRKIVKPLNTIGSGMELLREQDFSSRLSRVGQYEADQYREYLQPHDGTTKERTSPSARTESFSRFDD